MQYLWRRFCERLAKNFPRWMTQHSRMRRRHLSARAMRITSLVRDARVRQFTRRASSASPACATTALPPPAIRSSKHEGFPALRSENPSTAGDLPPALAILGGLRSGLEPWPGGRSGQSDPKLRLRGDACRRNVSVRAHASDYASREVGPREDARTEAAFREGQSVIIFLEGMRMGLGQVPSCTGFYRVAPIEPAPGRGVRTGIEPGGLLGRPARSAGLICITRQGVPPRGSATRVHRC